MAEDKHAYLIIAHNNFHTLSCLLSMLDDAHNDIYLHIDRKVKTVPWDQLRACVTHGRLIFTKRISVAWGHSSQIDCEMLLLRACCRAGAYAFVHLLSGVDLPIQTQSTIRAFFDAHPNTQFLQVGYGERHRYRLDNYHFFLRRPDGALYRFGETVSSVITNKLHYSRLKALGNPTLVKTANWFSLTGECARYVLSRAAYIRRMTRHTVCADEMFLGTVLYDSPYWKEVYNPAVSADGHQRFIDRERHVGSSPHTFTMEDKEALLTSPLLFARKFDERVDRDIIDLLYSTYKEKDSERHE